MLNDSASLLGLALGVGLFVLAIMLARRSKVVWDVLGLPARLSRTCPRCGTPLRFFRLPRSVKQLVLGGWTCRGCGLDGCPGDHEIP